MTSRRGTGCTLLVSGKVHALGLFCGRHYFFILDIGRLHKPVKLLATPDTSGEGVLGTSELRLAKALSGNLESAVRARRQA